MKAFFIGIALFLSFFEASSQQFTLETSLDNAVKETSGLLYLNNTLITHNDTANTNQLFEIDMTTGAVIRTVTITNATNEDWEDIAFDDTYIYIGDFGNYEGARTDLKVYRIAIADYIANTSITADVIEYSYSNQTDFTPSPLSTNFDAEALIHYNNNLYVFSKNWIDGNSNIYELPKTPGIYSINNIDTISAEGLISGATYNASNNSIMLTGYGVAGAFLIELQGFHSGLFSNGVVTKTNIDTPIDYSPQIEGIVAISANDYLISAEENIPFASGLYSFNTSTLNINENDKTNIEFYPNPADTSITLNSDHLKSKIYSTTGQLVKTSNQKVIDVSDLTSGLYMIKFENSLNESSVIRRLIIN